MSHTRPVTFGGQLHCPPKLAQVDERLKLEQLHAGHDRCTQSENNSSYKQYSTPSKLCSSPKEAPQAMMNTSITLTIHRSIMPRALLPDIVNYHEHIQLSECNQCKRYTADW